MAAIVLLPIVVDSIVRLSSEDTRLVLWWWSRSEGLDCRIEQTRGRGKVIQSCTATTQQPDENAEKRYESETGGQERDMWTGRRQCNPSSGEIRSSAPTMWCIKCAASSLGRNASRRCGSRPGVQGRRWSRGSTALLRRKAKDVEPLSRLPR